jgi:Domain of unknown function (DUF222)/HNH endonuclease
MNADLEQLGERIAELAAHLDAAAHRLLAALREFDERGGWHTQGALSCAHWLAWRVGWDLVTARERVRVARKLGEFPTIDDALRRGEISYSKVRALLRVATPANEALILEHARLTTASQLEKVSRKYARVQRHDQERRPQDDELRRYVRRRDTDDGMIKIEAVLHPEEAELVWSMLDHAAKHLARQSQRAPLSDPRSDSADSFAARIVDSGSPLSILDSAESCAAPDMERIRDSAESCAAPDVAGCGRADVSGCDHPHVVGCDGPAGSGSAHDAVRSDSAEAFGAGTSGRQGESGESCQALNASLLAAGPDVNADADAVGAVARAANDSAESPKMAGTLTESPFIGFAERCRAIVSKDGSMATAGRSLLDRLFDEVDADRATQDAARVAGEAFAAEEKEDGALSVSPVIVTLPAGATRVLHQRVDARTRAFCRADALCSIAQGYLRGDQIDRAPVDVVLTIPAGSLRRDARDAVDVGSVGETYVSSETARRLSCDAGVIEVLEDEHGVPLSVGRKRRTIAGSLKRALRRRDEACAFPGCTHRTYLEGHHIEHWADGGETKLDNAALLCSHHHRYVHEYGYVIELGDDRRPRFRDPRGRWLSVTPARLESPDLGWPHILAENEALAIDAETIACDWDGRDVPYARMIGTLVSVDRLT